MLLNVSKELKLPGSVVECDLEEVFPETEYLGRTYRFAQPVKVHVNCVYDGDGFDVKGYIDTVLCSECARCTKAFDEPFHVDIDERFVKTPEDDEDQYQFSGEALDLTQMVRDNILLNLPISSVCSEDCQGLCPHCGCDLNTTQCSCAAEDDETNPFAKLGALLNEIKEV